MMELDECRKAHPDAYVRIKAFDSSRGFETVMMSFIVNRPGGAQAAHAAHRCARPLQTYSWDAARR
jgi:ribulose-bisphosphate carboxylase small chain